MAECLKQMLALKGQAPTYIILDALGLHLPNLHICVTSRPEPDIQIVLECLTERPVSLHDKSGKRRILQTTSLPLFTRIEGWGVRGMRTRSWLSRCYQKGQKACNCAAVWLYVNVKHGIGSAGCSVNWSSYHSASRQVSHFGPTHCTRCSTPNFIVSTCTS
jgi:hypothetical protein